MEEIMAIRDSIELMKRENGRLADPVTMKGMSPMIFACSFSEKAASTEEVETLSCECPDDLREFWEVSQTARLFEDTEYGQWGLEIFGPKQSAEITDRCRSERQLDFIAGDLVFGKFLGDLDMALVRCDPNAHDFGNVLIALPLDPRSEWDHAGTSFDQFLERYVRSGGEKFWENHDGCGHSNAHSQR